MGKVADPLDPDHRIETFRVEGCTSNLWLVPSLRDGRCYFQVDSDSAVTKGIGAMLTALFNGSKPEEILEADTDFLAEIGVPQLLSPNRRNGVASLAARIAEFARHSSHVS